MQEDHFYDILHQTLDSEFHILNGENKGVITNSKETIKNEHNLYSFHITLAAEGTSLPDKDCSKVESNKLSQNNMLTSIPNIFND